MEYWILLLFFTNVLFLIFLSVFSLGNVASALCNAVIGNGLGVFVTPLLLVSFFGRTVALPFVEILMKLCNKVLVPVGKIYLF